MFSKKICGPLDDDATKAKKATVVGMIEMMSVRPGFGLLPRALDGPPNAFDVFSFPPPLAVSNLGAKTVDLRASLPPVYNQFALASCTANALCALFHTAFPHHEFSRLFLYYNERLQTGTVEKDAGSTIANGVAVLQQFGLCAESEWPYVVENFAVRPSESCYSHALKPSFAVSTFSTNSESLKKALCAHHRPLALGIHLYESYESMEVVSTGILKLPRSEERVLGWHAVVVVGYNDDDGRFMIRNSRGREWGLRGYFTIPYAYVEDPTRVTDAWMLFF